MTRLFNLESYSELCTYANLYETEIQSLAYKNFFDKYKEQGYRNDSIYPQELTITDELISLKHPGIYLSEDGNNLYVICDRIDTLSLKNFLKPGERYIYRSVYHYWNYQRQIASNLDLKRSIVFIDLNSLSDEPYCSLQFERSPKHPYHIPIIDNRRKENSDFKLPLSLKDIHNNIFHNLAQEILFRNFPQLASNNNTLDHLKSHLQKVEIFEIAQSQSDLAEFSVVVEIIEKEKIYYKSVILNIAFLEKIVVDTIDIVAIARFTQKHSEHSFVLISDYNFLPKFRKALNTNNIFIPENHLAEFPQIWLEKQKHNFPLFGQYLDKIKFQIQRNGKTQWIEVLSTEEQEHIYYEGDPETKRFIARIQDTGQEYFPLSHPYSVLPIQINDPDYRVNEITQEYQIIHPWSELKAQSKELIVRIEFIIKLGSVPELKVTDRENKHKIEARLQDYIEPSLNCIPLKTIQQNRLQKSCFIPSQERIEEFVDAISVIVNISNIEQAMSFRQNIKRAFDVIHRTNNNTDLFLNNALDYPSLEKLIISLSYFNNSEILKVILEYLQKPFNYNNSNSEEVKKFVKQLIMFIGKTYKLSTNFNLKYFFDSLVIKQAYYKVGNEYFLFLGRVALTKEFQLTYFRLFLNPWYYEQPLYKLDQYLWGYSRVLIWYSEFYQQYQRSEFDYVKHFTLIISHLLSNCINAGNNQHQEYQRNAFLSLIYLLTFREFDSQFCTLESKEYQIAKKVLDKFQSYPVKLKAISADKSLNEYFEELLNGNSSQEAIRRIIEAN